MALSLYRNIIQQLEKLDDGMSDVEKQFQPTLQQIAANNRTSALNLLQYLWLRKQDITKLQASLHRLGLSSIASSESHIHRQIQEVLLRLGSMLKKEDLANCTVAKARVLMNKRSAALFGKEDEKRPLNLMITLDSREATNVEYLSDLLQNGMRIARINCAHDNEKVWKQMIQALKKAQRHTQLTCKIYMDLAGPKFRVMLKGKGKENGKMDIELLDLITLYEPHIKCPPNERAIACHQKGVVEKLSEGSLILIDDGMIEAIVQTTGKNKAIIRITRISGKSVIKAGKGINFPQNLIDVRALTNDDLSSLPIVVKLAHMVGYSFVRHPSDIAFLRKKLHELKGLKKGPDLILKIETPEAVKLLPQLLLEAMKEGVFGVMIARGDLAVEIGFERLSEIQEEILWLCEAAHTPVIWATQVLEQLNKTGIASRSEITDAYKASQAECIMVNKGNYLNEVMQTLQNVAKRSRRHHLKKGYSLPPLKIAANFFKNA